MAFDPFGDRAERGYLRNTKGTDDPAEIARMEGNAFAANARRALRALEARPALGYRDVLATHRALFRSVYPWAGQDRAELAPGIAVGRAGMMDLFAHPADVRRAAEHALALGSDRARMAARPGEVFGLLAHSHPFLDGNGRTILVVHADLARRAGFHVAWENLDKATFLAALTEELRRPGRGTLDAAIAPHARPGALPADEAARRAVGNPSLGRRPPADGASPGGR